MFRPCEGWGFDNPFFSFLLGEKQGLLSRNWFILARAIPLL